jgi:hypothetical protein
MADQFHAFIQNLTVATTGHPRCAVIISLPRSQVEMGDWDLQWQEKITKVVRRVAKDLIANDETEIAEVVRRRLFDDLGNERVRKRVASTFADWCFELRAQLPPEWSAVDTAATEAKARKFLEGRFLACYPFHPATLSVFQRKWQALPQYQQTRGTLAMLAQWISWAQKDGFSEARREPLITLGSAPLHVYEFRSTVLGQLGESRLGTAIETDIAGTHAHARALDADTKGSLRDIHRRVGTAIFFESSGGQADKTAHLPELRFALGEPEVDTTSVDNAALALEARSFYLRRVGSDGFQIRYSPTLKKVASDRRASLDEQSEVRPALEALVRAEFDRGRTVPVVYFPVDGAEVQDSPRLTLVVWEPATEWVGDGGLKERVAEWTKQRGNSPRLYPGSLVWCFRKQGRELRERVEHWLAWKRVKREIDEGTLGGDFDRADRAEIQTHVKDAEEGAKDEVWASYRFVVLADGQEPDGLNVIDLGAGHSSATETLCGRVIAALKSQALLNEAVGAGYIDRNWPPALKESGAWPLSGLRQSFLNGTLTRLIDPDTVLRSKIVSFVSNGDLGLGSGQRGDGGYERVWFEEMVAPEEVAFEPGVFLLTKAKAKALRGIGQAAAAAGTGPTAVAPQPSQELATTAPAPRPDQRVMLRITGTIPSELWNRLGTKIIPKLKAGTDLSVGVEFTVNVDGANARSLTSELLQALAELGLGDRVKVEGV